MDSRAGTGQFKKINHSGSQSPPSPFANGFQNRFFFTARTVRETQPPQPGLAASFGVIQILAIGGFKSPKSTPARDLGCRARSRFTPCGRNFPDLKFAAPARCKIHELAVLRPGRHAIVTRIRSDAPWHAAIGRYNKDCGTLRLFGIECDFETIRRPARRTRRRASKMSQLCRSMCIRFGDPDFLRATPVGMICNFAPVR